MLLARHYRSPGSSPRPLLLMPPFNEAAAALRGRRLVASLLQSLCLRLGFFPPMRNTVFKYLNSEIQDRKESHLVGICKSAVRDVCSVRETLGFCSVLTVFYSKQHFVCSDPPPPSSSSHIVQLKCHHYLFSFLSFNETVEKQRVGSAQASHCRCSRTHHLFF